MNCYYLPHPKPPHRHTDIPAKFKLLFPFLSQNGAKNLHLQTWTNQSATMYSIYLLFIMCFLSTFYHFSVLNSWNTFKNEV